MILIGRVRQTNISDIIVIDIESIIIQKTKREKKAKNPACDEE